MSMDGLVRGGISETTAVPFLLGAEDGMATRDIPESNGMMCIACVDDCLSSCIALSDLADSVGYRPIFVSTDGRIPGWTVGGTFVLVSRTGECPEILGSFDSLVSAGHLPVVLTSGGTLGSMADEAGCHVIRISSELSEAAGQVLGILCSMTDQAVIPGSKGLLAEALVNVGEILPKLLDQASKVAERIRGGVTAVYSASEIRACSRYWAAVLSAKGMLSFCSELPEFDHNELVGWSDGNVHSPELRMVVLRSRPDGGMVSSIIGCMLEVLSENGRDVVIVDIGGGSTLERDIVGFLLGDAVSVSMGVSE